MSPTEVSAINLKENHDEDISNKIFNSALQSKEWDSAIISIQKIFSSGITVTNFLTYQLLFELERTQSQLSELKHQFNRSQIDFVSKLN